jgi:hypothetical protein
MRSRNLASLSRWLRSVSSMLLSSSFRPSSCCFTARTSGSSVSSPGPDSDTKQLSTDTGSLHLSSTQDSGRAEPVACMVVARWINNVLNVLKGALTIATGGSLKHVASLEPAINTTATNQTVKRSMSEHDTPRFWLITASESSRHAHFVLKTTFVCHKFNMNHGAAHCPPEGSQFVLFSTVFENIIRHGYRARDRV